MWSGREGDADDPGVEWEGPADDPGVEWEGPSDDPGVEWEGLADDPESEKSIGEECLSSDLLPDSSDKTSYSDIVGEGRLSSSSSTTAPIQRFYNINGGS